MKEIENNLNELEESLSKYCDYDDPEYRGIRDVGNLFNGIAFSQSSDKDYYKSIKTKSAFNGNYIKVKEIKIKIYYLKNILI